METMPRFSVSRRQVLIGAGGLMGAVGLAACSGEESTPDAFGNGGGTDLMESPMLTEQVEAGELPELSDRLPANPMVMEPWDGPGRFGGTLNRATANPDSASTHRAVAHANLLEWNWEGDGAMPSLAEAYQPDETNTSFSFTLREGTKWSDGEPLTTADIEFAWDAFYANETLHPAPPDWLTNLDGSLAELDIEDDLTFSIRFNEPAALFEREMCFPNRSEGLIKPRHYLEQFHPDYASEEQIDELLSEDGFATWDQLFIDRHAPWTNADLPVLGAYLGSGILDSQGSGRMERNPYYWKVDPDGRQLPYIDAAQVQELEQEALDLRGANGDLEFQGYQLGYNSAQVFLQNAEDNDYEVHRWGLEDGAVSLCLNLSHYDENLREVFEEYDFRVALSIAIDREDMNDTLMGGLGEIRQPLPTEFSEYYIEGVGGQHLQYDADEANRLLDGLGLERGSDGIRTLSDGTALSLLAISLPNDAGIVMSDVLTRVAQYWEEIGIELNHQHMDNTLYTETWQSNDYDIDATYHFKTDTLDLEPVWYVPLASNSHSMPAYGMWYSSGGSEGIEPPDEIKELLDNWEELTTAASDEERVTAGQNIVQQHEDNLYVIGVLGLPFQPVIVSNVMNNVRDDEPMMSYFHGREAFAKPEQIFFADGE